MSLIPAYNSNMVKPRDVERALREANHIFIRKMGEEDSDEISFIAFLFVVFLVVLFVASC